MEILDAQKQRISSLGIEFKSVEKSELVKLGSNKKGIDIQSKQDEVDNSSTACCYRMDADLLLNIKNARNRLRIQLLLKREK